MSLRAATPEDLDAIMVLERASFGPDAWSPSMMRDELGSPHTHYLVLHEAGRIRGYAGLRAVAGAKDADIQTIALADTARGRGQGRMLLTALLAEAAHRGVRKVFLDVRDDNTVAQRLYASEGFAPIGRRPKYYAAPGVDAIVMQLDVLGWLAARAPDPVREAGFGAGALAEPNPETPSESDGAQPDASAPATGTFP